MRRYFAKIQKDSDKYSSRYLQVFIEKYLHIVAHSEISAAPPSAGICKYVLLNDEVISEKIHAHTYPLRPIYCFVSCRYLQIPAK